MTKKIILTIVAVAFALPVWAQIEIDSLDQVAAIPNSTDTFNTIEIIDPVDGTWKKATNNTIKWKVTGLKKDFKVAFELFADGEKVIPLVKGIEVKKGEAVINYRKIMNVKPGSYTLRMFYSGSRYLVSADNSYAGFKSVMSRVNIIDADAPRLIITSPTEGAIVDASKAFRMTWYANFTKKTKSTTGDFNIVPEYGVGANGQSILLSRIPLEDREILSKLKAEQIDILVQVNSPEYYANPSASEFAQLNKDAEKIPSYIKYYFINKISRETMRILNDVDFDQLATEINADNNQKELSKNKDKLEDITDDFDNGRTKLVFFAQNLASGTSPYKIATTNVESGSKKINFKKVPEGRYQIYAIAGVSGYHFKGPAVTIKNTKQQEVNPSGINGLTGTVKYEHSLKNKQDLAHKWLETNLLIELKLAKEYPEKEIESIALLDSNNSKVLMVQRDNWDRTSVSGTVVGRARCTQFKNISCGIMPLGEPGPNYFYNKIYPGRDYSVRVDMRLIDDLDINHYQLPRKVDIEFTDKSILKLDIINLVTQDGNVNTTQSVTGPIVPAIDTNRIDLPVTTPIKQENKAVASRNVVEGIIINSPRPNNVWYKGMKKLISVKGPRIVKIKGKDAPYDRYLVKLLDSSGASVSDFATVDGMASQFESSSVLTMYKTATTLTLKDSLADGNYKMIVAFCSYTRNCNSEDMNSMPNASVDFVVKTLRTRAVTTPTASVIDAVNYRPEYGNNGFSNWLNNVFR